MSQYYNNGNKSKSALDKLSKYLPDFLGGTVVKAKKKNKKLLDKTSKMK